MRDENNRTVDVLSNQSEVFIQLKARCVPKNDLNLWENLDCFRNSLNRDALEWKEFEEN